MKFTDIESAFEYVSSDQPCMNTVMISRSKGETYYHTEMGDNFDEMPEDVDVNDDYVEIPHKNDMDLGERLVWRFVEKEIPGLHDKVRGFFTARGAYYRYKTFLDQIDLLERWYEFESNETEKALRKWCQENRIEIDG